MTPQPKRMALNSREEDLLNMEWKQCIEKVVRAVVSIHFCSVTSFDTERPYVSEATGFVVDKENGIIMTNRHVVGPGPFFGYAVFDNHEECPVLPVYRDPIHDFGFLKFDPTTLKHMKIQSLDLHPEHATVGCEIKVVGNDAGEKLSILSGIISRVDRNAPDYGDMTYNDFNTEYIQAAAAASGGSSGSPVVDKHGYVVALQAGGSSVASTDFFLPLYRAQRALKCIQNGAELSRGTIQVRWLIKPYDECIRLGLSDAEEQLSRLRHPDSNGMLVADSVLPQGPADGHILEGDCLIAINDIPVAKFYQLEGFEDELVGTNAVYTIIRNGEKLQKTIAVQDLFDITPDRFVRVSGGVFHNLSYQIASYYSLPVKGVYVAFTGTYFNPTQAEDYTGWIIDELDYKPTRNLEEFVEVVLNIPSGKRVPAKFRHVTDIHTIVTSVVDVNRQWVDGPQDFEVAICNNVTGVWDFTSLGTGAPPVDPKLEAARFAPLNYPNAPPAVLALNNSIVRVKMLRPALLEGFTLPESHQHGFVVDANQGYVLVSRVCVPHYLVDLCVVFAESVILPAKVVFLHPQLGYAIIQYNPALIKAEITSIPLPEPHYNESEQLKQGTPLSFIGYDAKGSAYAFDTRVADVSTTPIPLGFDVPPRFRATNMDTIGVDSSIIPEMDSGLLADPQTGVVRAIWSTFMGDINVNTRRDRLFRFAIDASALSNTVNLIKSNPQIDPMFLDCEVKAIKIATARIYRVPDSWIDQFDGVEGIRLRPQLLCISRVSEFLSKFLVEGDVLLKINDKLATNVSQLYDFYGPATTAKLSLIRAGEYMEIDAPLKTTSSTITKSLVSFGGMNVHQPHHAVLQQVKNPPSRVYITSCHAGSPATLYGLFSTCFITHVNGKPTPDLDTFYDLVKSVPDDTYVKFRLVTYDGVPQAMSMRTNYHYFPTWRIDLVNGEWKKTQ